MVGLPMSYRIYKIVGWEFGTIQMTYTNVVTTPNTIFTLYRSISEQHQLFGNFNIIHCKILVRFVMNKYQYQMAIVFTV